MSRTQSEIGTCAACGDESVKIWTHRGRRCNRCVTALNKISYARTHPEYRPVERDPLKRLMAKTSLDPASGCLLWTGAKNRKRYGICSLGLVHRAIWKLLRGPIPDGLLICHHCDTPACVNVEHLFLGTESDNAQDSANKGRMHIQKHPEIKQGERHPMSRLTESQVLEIRNRRNSGEMVKQLSKEFGISPGTVFEISTGRTWKHVPLSK